MSQRHFELTIKEKGGAVIHPSYIGDVDRDRLVEFFGLNKSDVESFDIHEVHYCCICGKRINGHPHNAAPLKDGVCCDECNATRVLPERIRLTKQQ